MRKMICLLTALLLLAALPLGVWAEEDVQAMVDELPTVEEIQVMELEEQREAYDRVQEVYDAYMALGEDRLKIRGGEEKFDVLFAWFNMQVMPVEQEPEAQEQSLGSNLVSTALAVIPVILLLQYMEKKKVR